MKRTKEIAYSYPTSDNATQAGFYATGCWTIETREHNCDIPKARQSFPLDTAESEIRKWANDCLPSYEWTGAPQFADASNSREFGEIVEVQP